MTSRPRRLLLGLLGLLVVLAAVAAAAVLQRDDEPAPLAQERAPVAQDEPGPVLLVPGYGGSATSLDVLAEDLRAAGRTVTVIEPPGDGRGDLRETARVLAEAAAQAVEAGAPSVDVVGFSAGGVIARYWAAELAGEDVARRVVTLGSPHHGTGLAAIGARVGRCPPGCLQLAPDSELLQELNAADETPDGPLWTTIWTDQDETVTPPDSARLEGATQVVVQQVCPGIAVRHSDLPRTPVIMAIVLEALAVEPPPASYGPQDCARLSA